MTTNPPSMSVVPTTPTTPTTTTAATNTSVPPPKELQDIVDALGILDVRQLVLIGVVTVVVLALAAYLARLWWRRRQRLLAEIPPGPPPLPAHERARRRLEDALRHLDDPPRFCTEVSFILREYIEERFDWNAPDRTTEEFLNMVQRRPELGEDHKALLQDFLTRCDFVKFARYEPTESELVALQKAAVRFVSDTVPPPPPPPGAHVPPHHHSHHHPRRPTSPAP